MSIKKIILKSISFIFISIILFVNPTNAQTFNSTLDFHTLVIPVIADLQYEAKEKTSLENPVVDPNFNVMREEDMNKFQALFLVGGILVIAVIAPLAAWWYFSK